PDGGPSAGPPREPPRACPCSGARPGRPGCRAMRRAAPNGCPSTAPWGIRSPDSPACVRAVLRPTMGRPKGGDAESLRRGRRVGAGVAELENRRLAPGPPDLAQRVAHLAHGHVRARGVDDRGHQISVLVGRLGLQSGERRLGRGRVAARPPRLDALDLVALEGGVDVEDLDLLLVRVLVAVHAHDHALAALDLVLEAEGRLGDLALEEVLLDRRDDAAELADAPEVVVCLLLEPVRQLFEQVRAAQRIDRVDDAGLVREYLLRP